MYRASHESFAETIEKLERELAEMRGLSGSPRRRMKVLASVTGLSLVATFLLGIACEATHERAERLQRHMTEAAALLDSREHDLHTCTTLANEQLRATTQCKLQWAELTSRSDCAEASAGPRPGTN
jgi:hypothetical protein